MRWPTWREWIGHFGFGMSGAAVLFFIEGLKVLAVVVGVVGYVLYRRFTP